MDIDSNKCESSVETKYVLGYCELFVKGCEQAKEFAEKSKHGNIPGPVVSALAHLAQHERAYLSLLFLEQKWFSRRDPLKNAFLNLENDFKLIANHENRNVSSSGKDANAISPFVVKLCTEMSTYCAARADCIDLYERMLKPPASWKLCDLKEMANVILKKYKSSFDCEVLQSIKTGFTNELYVLKTLLQTSSQISEWTFFLSLVNLHKIREKLEENPHLLKKEAMKSSFFSFRERPAVASSAVHQWLNKYFLNLYSKYTFYFYKALSEQAENIDEMKFLCARTNEDYVNKCHTFCKKTDHAHVMLGMDCRNLKEPPRHGYNLPQILAMEQKDTPTFMKILELPNEININQWRILESLCLSNEDNKEKIIYKYDKQTMCNYYAVWIENRMYMGVTIEGKRAEKDSYTNSFINEITESLKPKKCFSMLRSGIK